MSRTGATDHERKIDTAFASYYQASQMLSTLSLLGYTHASYKLATKAVESRPHDVIWARMMAHVGSTRFCAGNLDQAEADLNESIEILDKVGDY